MSQSISMWFCRVILLCREKTRCGFEFRQNGIIDGVMLCHKSVEFLFFLHDAWNGIPALISRPEKTYTYACTEIAVVLNQCKPNAFLMVSASLFALTIVILQCYSEITTQTPTNPTTCIQTRRLHWHNKGMESREKKQNKHTTQNNNNNTSS